MEEEKEMEWREININASNIKILLFNFYLKYLAASKMDVFSQNYDRFPFISVLAVKLWEQYFCGISDICMSTSHNLFT